MKLTNTSVRTRRITLMNAAPTHPSPNGTCSVNNSVGTCLSCSNCDSRRSPPCSKHAFNPVPFPRALKNLPICCASSRVGARMSARAPGVFARCFRDSSRGRRKHAVFPDPVRAIATTSRPASASGMVLRWIGVGILYPIFATASRTCSFVRPRARHRRDILLSFPVCFLCTTKTV